MACTALHMTTAAIATLAFVFGTASQNKMHELGRMERELMRMETQLESLKMRLETKQTKLEMLQMEASLTATLLQVEERLTATIAQAWGVPVPAVVPSAAAPAVPPVIATDPLEKLTMKILTMEVQVAEKKLEIAMFDDKKNNSGNVEKCRREVAIAELEWEKKQWEYELMKETNEERKKALRETIDEIQNDINSKEKEEMQQW